MSVYNSTGWVAVYDRAATAGRFDCTVDVHSWDDEGRALIVDRRAGALVPAQNLPGFKGLEQTLRIIAALPAAPGWNLKVWESSSAEGTSFVTPIAVWLVTEAGQVIPVSGISDSYLEPIERQRTEIQYPVKVGHVTDQLTVEVGRRAARAILIDDRGCLMLIKRTKPGQAPYWTAPGGGVEDSDASVEAALYRELMEELGAKAADASQVFLFSSRSDTGVAVQHFFVTRLVGLDESARSGAEFDDPSRGGYDLDRVSLRGADLEAVDLRPAELKEFILANREALLVEANSGR